jgi:peroxiredoxin
LRGYQKEGVVQAIRAAGGEIYGVTSEPQTLASEAQESWGLEFPLVGDPHHEIADACRARGWLDLFVNAEIERHGMIARGHDTPSHPKGYFQPGVLALDRERRILYRWRSVPTRRNNGGATERPTPAHVWGGVQQALASPGAADAALEAKPTVDMQAIPWPLFVALLLANGNFWRPKGFGLMRRGPDDVAARGRRAMARLALFVAAWAAAFVLLPAGWVALALLGWAALVAPGIVEMHRAFQAVPPEES